MTGSTEIPSGGRKWYQWHSPEDTPEERRFLVKRDATLLPIVLLSFWIENLDYANINKKCMLRSEVVRR